MSYSDFSGPGEPLDFGPGDLAGEIRFQISDHHTDLFASNRTALLVEQRLAPGVRYAAWCALTNELLPTRAVVVAQRALLERLRPWARPDRSPFPHLTLFPVAAAVWRVLVAAWELVRYGPGDIAREFGRLAGGSSAMSRRDVDGHGEPSPLPDLRRGRRWRI